MIDEKNTVELVKEHLNRDYPIFVKDNSKGFDWILDRSIKEARTSYRNIASSIKKEPTVTPLDDHDILGIAFQTLLVALCKNKIEKSEIDLGELASTLRGLGPNGVFFIGAGFCFELAVDWHTARECALACFGDTERDYIEGLKEDWNAGGTRRERVWRELEDKGRESNFQTALCDIIAAKSPQQDSPHAYLAFLIQDNRIAHIVCFNWDDLIEKACERISIVFKVRCRDERGDSTDWFWKPHGCVRRRDLDFILPHKDVALNKDFIEAMKIPLTSPRARVVVCIGFSGDERFNKDQLREIVGSPPEVYDIRPNTERFGELGKHIPMVASYALPRIVEVVRQ